MGNYRDHVIGKAITDKLVFTNIELLEFIIFDVLLVGNYHVGRGDLESLVDTNLLDSGTFDILIVSHQQGNVVITVYCDNNGFFRITDVKVEEPSRRPLYSFPVDSPESIQITINEGRLLIWGTNNTLISMKTSDVLVTGKHWHNSYHFSPIVKINKDEVLDYFLDFIGIKIDQASYHLIKHDITTRVMNTGEPVRLSIKDNRECSRVRDKATVSKQMILIDKSTNDGLYAYNLDEKTFYKKDGRDIKFVAMSIRYDDDNRTLFTCAMGTQNKGSSSCYYIDDVEVSLKEHKPLVDRFTKEHEMGEIMRELDAK